MLASSSRKKQYTLEEITELSKRLEGTTLIASDILTAGIMMSHQVMGQDPKKGGGVGAYGRYYDPSIMKGKYDSTELDFDKKTLDLLKTPTPDVDLEYDDLGIGVRTKTDTRGRTMQLKSFLLAVEEFDSGRSVTLVGLDDDIYKALEKDSKWSDKIKTMKESGRFRSGRKMETHGITRSFKKRPDIVRDDILHMLHQDGVFLGSNYARPRDGVDRKFEEYKTKPDLAKEFYDESSSFEYGGMLSTKIGMRGLLNPDMPREKLSKGGSDVQKYMSKELIQKLITDDDWSKYSTDIEKAYKSLVEKDPSLKGIFKPKSLSRSRTESRSGREEKEVESIPPVTDMEVPEELRGMTRGRSRPVAPRGGMRIPDTPTPDTPTIETRPRSNDVTPPTRPRRGGGTPPPPPLDIE